MKALESYPMSGKSINSLVSTITPMKCPEQLWKRLPYRTMHGTHVPFLEDPHLKWLDIHIMSNIISYRIIERLRLTFAAL